MALYVAVTYGILYLLLTTFSYVYPQQYHFGEGTVGLAFLPAGLGMAIGVVSFGQLTDAMVRRRQAKGVEHRPEVRLAPVLTIPCGVVLPIGLFLYGWTTDKGVHWIAPMIGVCLFSAGLMGVMVSSYSSSWLSSMDLANPYRCRSRTTSSTHTHDMPHLSQPP